MKAILLLMTVLHPAFVFASIGHDQGGGGDPLASEFIRVARAISTVLTDQSSAGELQKTRFDTALERVSESLSGTNPLVVFPDGTTISCYQAPKIGCVPGDGRIHIARQGWAASTEKDKIEIAAMELSLLAGIGQKRYEFAPDLAIQVLARGFTLPSPLTPEYVSANQPGPVVGMPVRDGGVKQPFSNSTQDGSVDVQSIPVGSQISFREQIYIPANTSRIVVGQGVAASWGRLKCYLMVDPVSKNQQIPALTTWTIKSIDSHSPVRVAADGLEIYYPIIFTFKEAGTALYCEGFSVMENATVARLNSALAPTLSLVLDNEVQVFGAR